MLSQGDAVEQTGEMIEWRKAEQKKLDRIHDYWRGKQPMPGLPTGTPLEVRRLAAMSRVNITDLIVSNIAQSMFVDGYRAAKESENAAAWDVWQANKMDARQSGLFRVTAAYGVGYTTVLPGDTSPVIRTFSPRKMTTMYGEDPDWPVWALQTEPSNGKCLYRLLDDEGVYYVEGDKNGDKLTFIESSGHDVGVCPVVRFLNVIDPDDELLGEIEPIMPIQDQVDLTTFELLVAQHFAAFRQRYAIGWVADSEEKRAMASASRMWTFDENPSDMTLGEFQQTDVKGYIESREASLRHAAAISQTPAHELIGQLVNLSAEALVAAEMSQRRKISERETTYGESVEQTLWLAGQIGGYDVPDDAQVRWRDTEARSFASTVDALGKLATMLNIPAQELWERIPGVTQQDVDRWKAASQSGDAFGNLSSLLEQQMGGGTVDDPEEIKKKADALGVLIRAGANPDDAARKVGLGGVRFTGAVPSSLRLPESQASGLENV